jgi:hypothetical protein
MISPTIMGPASSSVTSSTTLPPSALFPPTSENVTVTTHGMITRSKKEYFKTREPLLSGKGRKPLFSAHQLHFDTSQN